MPEPNSPFYPPRAPWYAPAREMRHTVVDAIGVRRIPTPKGVSFRDLVLGFCIPGQAFIRRRRNLGYRLMTAYGLLFVLGLAFLGQLPASLFFGLAISIHATSLVLLISPSLRTLTPPYRILTSGVAVAGLIVFAYLPLQELTSHYLFQPIQSGDEIIVVHPTRNPAGIRRGDWVVYQTEHVNLGQVIFHAGLGFGPVYAFPGETVEFKSGFLLVGGKTFPAVSGMPTSGSVQVPDNCWFIWHHLRTLRSVGVDAETIQASIAGQSIVDRRQIRGRPFNRWFHRPQILAAP